MHVQLSLCSSVMAGVRSGARGAVGKPRVVRPPVEGVVGDMVRAGTVVGGRYTLIRVLGAGGFGQVWLAEDTDLGVEVALKRVYLPGPVSPDEQRQRTARAVREARHAARLRDHPGIVTVHDAFAYEGSPWIVMQYVDGSSLAQELRQRGRLPADRVSGIAEAMLAALGAAHAADIVHRDVKPANVLLAADGRVLLTDFGIAVAPSDATLTSSSVVIGSPGYVAPERWQGAETGAAADLFALGVTLYEAVEGESPFPRQNPVAVLTEEPRPPVHAGPLGALLLRLLAKQPERRPDVTAARALLAAASPTVREPTLFTGPTAPTASAAPTPATKVITKERHPERTPERPPALEPFTVTSRRLEVMVARGAKAMRYGGVGSGIVFAAIMLIGVISDGANALPFPGWPAAANVISVGIIGGSIVGLLGAVYEGWTVLTGDPDSLTVSPGGMTVTGEGNTAYTWDEFQRIELRRDGSTVTVRVRVPPRGLDSWHRKHRVRLDGQWSEVFVGRGISPADAGRLTTALGRWSGDLYQGPSGLA
ncbi:serine/threonine-protein kinase [Streptomyces hydrogenans]|uniref:serine/threonine-protein kinase n=1 Tax=Streptomyces hydrogenans TaxID=1873719 RepID=UPI00342D5AD2